MEDDLQLIETFESDEWKTFVGREVSRHIKWTLDIKIDFQVKNLNHCNNNCYNVCYFQASFNIKGAIYSTTISEEIYRIRQMGNTLYTNSIIVKFYHSLCKCEKDEKFVEALVRSVEPPQKNSLFSIAM